MLEKDMRRLLKHKFSVEIPHAVFQPIESGGTGIGIPDFFFRTLYKEGWIELKEVELTSHGIIVIHYRPGQLRWMRDYTRANGNMILLATYKKSIYTIGWESIWIAIKGRNILDKYTTEAWDEAATFFMGHLNDINLSRLL